MTLEYDRIGIYGGAFNPVHCGHLQVAQAATQYLGLDVLLWVPTGHAWHKPVQLVSAKDRVAMLELAFKSVPSMFLEKWRIDTLELDREGASYTIETLELLRQKYCAREWFLLIGADQLLKFQTWERWRDVVQYSKLAVVDRPGAVRDAVAGVVPGLEWVSVPFEQVDVSSSRIRELLNLCSVDSVNCVAAQEELNKSLPCGVLAYIQKHHLYEV